MFQTFEASTRPEDGPPRLAALRGWMADQQVDAFLVPRADKHQGEYVTPRDSRLAWLTGFTGSAGIAVITGAEAGLFVDGRYTVQAPAQIDTDHFTPVPWPKTRPGPWLKERLETGATVAYDPWLHTKKELEELKKALKPAGITLKPLDDPFDSIWPDRPAPPLGAVTVHEAEYAGQSSDEKRSEIAKALTEAGQSAAVITLPDSLCWLLNVRGQDVEHTPVFHGLGVIGDDGKLALYADHPDFAALSNHLGPDVTVHPSDQFLDDLGTLSGTIRVDQGSAPQAVIQAATNANIAYAADLCALPKARKNATELQGLANAHLRDGAAMARLLAWLDETAPKGNLTEIDVVKYLENCRAQDPLLRDISFETISGSGPNGAIVHYRVTEETNRQITPGELLLVDSGGQYLDGTTDITRTLATGPVGAEERTAFTRVLQGMIDLSDLRWPKGRSGRQLDAVARVPLWRMGRDYDHGTGHGVGAFLSVHEGPQSISSRNGIALDPGMVCSIEPGYYRAGAFGIRIENLAVVTPAPALEGADDREMLVWETLTWCPIDRRLIDPDLLDMRQRAWLDHYHAQVLAKIGPLVDGATLTWLQQACAPLT